MRKNNYEELKSLSEMLETSKEMIRMCYSKDGKLRHSIPMICMIEGISVGMVLGMAMQLEMDYIVEKREKWLGREEADDAHDM